MTCQVCVQVEALPVVGERVVHGQVPLQGHTHLHAEMAPGNKDFVLGLDIQKV